jgi:hypothetical protein
MLASLMCGSIFDHHAVLLPTVDGRWLSVVLLSVLSKAAVMALEFEASFGQDSLAVWSVSLRLRRPTWPCYLARPHVNIHQAVLPPAMNWFLAIYSIKSPDDSEINP